MAIGEGVAFALGGLAGNNGHGAGFLQAALETGVRPEMISCTSGQLLWVWHYLQLLDSGGGSAKTDSLQARFADKLNELGPSRLMLEACLPGLVPPSAFLDWTSELSQRWPFARDFAWWSLAYFGKQKRYLPAYESLPLDLLRNWQQSIEELTGQIKDGGLHRVFLLEFVANLFPNRVLKPDFDAEFFSAISDAFNQESFGGKPIGIVFNSYDPTTGYEYLHINEVARRQLGRTYGDPSSYRRRTRYAKIDPDAVRNALWLYMYGFSGAHKRLDGAYYRDVILSELCAPAVRLIYAVRPLNREWIGPLPGTYAGGKDLETEVGFNGTYVGERDKIDLMNKVGAELSAIRAHLEQAGVKVPPAIGRTLSKYREIKVIEVEPDTQRGYFDYVFEDKALFNNARAKGHEHLSRSA